MDGNQVAFSCDSSDIQGKLLYFKYLESFGTHIITIQLVLLILLTLKFEVNKFTLSNIKASVKGGML